MRWQSHIITEITGKLVQMGLEQCPICDSGSLTVDSRPIVLPWGGAPWPTHTGVDDPDANILYMIHIQCELCGYSLLFNCEKFITGNTPALEPAPQ